MLNALFGVSLSVDVRYSCLEENDKLHTVAQRGFLVLLVDCSAILASDVLLCTVSLATDALLCTVMLAICSLLCVCAVHTLTDGVSGDVLGYYYSIS